MPVSEYRKEVVHRRETHRDEGEGDNGLRTPVTDTTELMGWAVEEQDSGNLSQHPLNSGNKKGHPTHGCSPRGWCPGEGIKYGKPMDNKKESVHSTCPPRISHS